MNTFSKITKLYIYSTILIGAFFLYWNLGSLDAKNILLLCLLCLLGSVSLLLKVEGATVRSHYNTSFLVYAFTLIVLGTPSAILVVLISHLVEWLWHRYPWYIQMFNLTSYVVVMQTTGLIYQWINPRWMIGDFVGVLGAMAALAFFTLMNHLMIGIVLYLARGENFRSSGIFEPFPLVLDFILLGMGAGVALVWEFNPFGILLILPPLYLIYSTLKVPALERKSETDAKTGLFNARYFSDALENELARANRFDRPLTVIMADLDLLRNINNTYGHLAGDEVLIGVAKILKECVREYDVVARFGGEEFVVMVPEAAPLNTFERVEYIRKKIESAEFTIPTSILPIRITMSFGIAGREGFSQTAKDIIHNADIALYHAKLTGRNRTSVYDCDGYQGLNIAPAENRKAPTIQSVEERIQFADTPYQPNPLRDTPHGNASRSDGEAPVENLPVSSPEPQAPEAPAEAPEPLKPASDKGSKKLLNLLLSAMTIASMGLFLLLFRLNEPIDWLGLAVFTIIVVLAEWLSINIYIRDTSVSTSAAPMIAGSLLFGPLGAAVVSIAFALVALIKHRSPLSRLIFNASNQMIAGGLYLGIIFLSRVAFKDWPIPVQITMALIAGGITYLSTTSLVAAVIHLDRGAPFRHIWNEEFSWLAPYYLSMGLIAYALVFSYQLRGFTGTLIILIPLLLLRISQVQYIDRTREIVKELREKNVALENNAREISSLNDDLFGILADAVDLRDPYVKKHSDQVSRYSALIARKLSLPERQVEMIRKAGQIHDVGKLGIPDSILNKRSSLSRAEYQKIQSHVTLGAEFLNSFTAMRGLIPVVRYHHERFDGGGYPDGLKGHAIPLEARIVCVADSVEAMASDRPYRPALTLQEIVEQLTKGAGKQFDPIVVQAFMDVINTESADLIININQKWINEHPEKVKSKVMFQPGD